MFHVALLLVLVRHLRYFTEPVWGWVALIQPFGIYAGIRDAGRPRGLWARRFLVDRVRYISSPSDHLMLALLIAIGATGLAMKYRRPHRHRRAEGVRARADAASTGSRCRPTRAAGASGAGRGADDRLPGQQAAACARACSSARPATRPTTRASGAPRGWAGASTSRTPNAPAKWPPPIRNAGAEGIPGHPDPAGRRDGAQQAVRRQGRRSRRRSVFPGELVEDWQDKAIAKMGELLGKYRSLKVYLDACVHCGACTDKCHYFLGTGDPKNMPVARQDLMRKVYRRYFTLAGQVFPEAGRRRGPDPRSARRVVQLLPPVLRVPPLLGVLPVRHRHRRDHHGRARNHGLRRHGAEVHQRDHRQGAQDRQQPGPARDPALRKHARRPGGGRQGRHRGRRQVPARREGRRGAAGHAVGRLSSPSRTSTA